MGLHGSGAIVMIEACKPSLRRQVAMIIEDRLTLGMLVEQPAGSLVAQQEIVVDEGHNEALKQLIEAQLALWIHFAH